jgi:kynurenine formamidase
MDGARAPDTTADAAWFAATFERVKNWGRWGSDDERGALNLLTPERTAAAASLVREGDAVSCALDLSTVPAADNPHPLEHHMLTAGDARGENPLPGFEQSADYFGIACHGMAVSHIDALCHVFVDGRMYNGFPASDVRSTGARRNTLQSVAGGICGRGVLLDVPRVLGRDWLEPGERITPDDLERAERELGVTVEPGDILLVATGRARHRRAEGAGIIARGMAGLHHECIPWLRERDVAVLGSDGISDVFGTPMVDGWAMPIHQCVIAAMGVHLLDNLDLATLADACAAHERWAFLLTIAPLRIPRATGCPVNPIAVF